MGELANVLRLTENEDFCNKYGRLKPALNASIILTCRSGRRSAEAQSICQQLGYMK